MNQPTQEQLNDPTWWDENAPEWATMIGRAGPGRRLVWADLTHYGYSGVFGAYLFGDGQNFAMHQFSALAKRPKAKPDRDDGELPPIGTECEATWLELPDGGSRDFERVLIKGYYDHVDAVPQVWLTTWGGDELVLRLEDCAFRPLRTQAEREIEDLQQDLMGILPFCEYTDDQIKEMAKILHTQGYRKPDAGLLRKGEE